MGKETAQQIKSKLNWYIFSKFLGLIFAILTLIPVVMLGVASIQKDAELFLKWIVTLLVATFFVTLMIAFNTQTMKKLDAISKYSIDEYLRCILNTKSYFCYSEYIVWFSRYVREIFIEKEGSRKMSLLHEVTYVNRTTGFCPAFYHMNSFKELVKLILDYDVKKLSNENEIKLDELRETILYGKNEENRLFPQSVHEPYVVLHVVVGIIFVFGAIVSGLDADYSFPFSLNIHAYKITALISNLCFYLPVVYIAICVHKWDSEKRQDKKDQE